ncbi:MAG: hypothetical protein ACRDRJ_00630 [Streptosporangiaceae bacterium]
MNSHREKYVSTRESGNQVIIAPLSESVIYGSRQAIRGASPGSPVAPSTIKGTVADRVATDSGDSRKSRDLKDQHGPGEVDESVDHGGDDGRICCPHGKLA